MGWLIYDNLCLVLPATSVVVVFYRCLQFRWTPPPVRRPKDLYLMGGTIKAPGNVGYLSEAPKTTWNLQLSRVESLENEETKSRRKEDRFKESQLDYSNYIMCLVLG